MTLWVPETETARARSDSFRQQVERLSDVNRCPVAFPQIQIMCRLRRGMLNDLSRHLVNTLLIV